MNPTSASLQISDLPENAAISAPATGSADSSTKRVCSWFDSIWLQLAVSAVFGLLYMLLVMGPESLNPRNTDWLCEDAAHHYIGWEMLRQDRHWRWPLMYSQRLGYPVGESVALVDVNPWLALPGKMFSPLLPEPFQYFGIEAVICYALQFFFALRLLRLFLGTNLLGIWIGSLFFLIAPPLTFRLKFHYCLSNHWLLLAGLIVFFQAQQEVPNAVRRFVISALVLTGVAIATNPYIAFQVVAVLAAAVLSLWWKAKLSLPRAAGLMAAMGLLCVGLSLVLGFIIAGGKGYGGHGYRVYSMNLLAPLNPGWFGSIIFPAIVPHLEKGQYEGYAYLGAGVIVLAVIVLLYALLRPAKLKAVLDRRWLVPLLLCCVCLTLMALTTKVVVGGKTLVDIDPQQMFSRFLAPLRSSGRLFWLPYYTILTGLLAAPCLFMRRTRANALLACLLVLQFADTAPLRRFVYAAVHQTYPQPLKSPIWRHLGSVYQNLVVLPPWQCGPYSSPGGAYGYRYFGFLAADQNMRINSYYTARYTGKSLEYHCDRPDADSASPLSPDSAYVVTPAIAAQIANRPGGDGKCHDLDGFILCSPRTDFGLSARPIDPGTSATP